MTGKPPPRPGPRLYTPGEVAIKLGVSPVTVLRWGNTGKIGVVRLPGGQRRYYADEVDKWLNGDGR